MAPGLGRAWPGRAGRRRPGRAALQADRRAAGGGGGGAGGRAEGQRVPDADVDAGPGRRGDRAGERDPLLPDPDLDGAAEAAGLDQAAPGPAGGGAERGGDRRLGEAGLAADKKSARRRGAWIIFQDESGFSLLPPVRATWAPRGKTPVLRHRFSWKRLSMSGALGYRPDGSQATLMFQIKPGSYNTGSLIA